MIKSRRMRWAGHVAHMEKRNAYRISVRKSVGRVGGWGDNITMDIRDIKGDMDWIDLAQDRYQWRGSCEHGNEPSSSIKYWGILE
jgi:hypothetical protein